MQVHGGSSIKDVQVLSGLRFDSSRAENEINLAKNPDFLQDNLYERSTSTLKVEIVALTATWSLCTVAYRRLIKTL